MNNKCLSITDAGRNSLLGILAGCFMLSAQAGYAASADTAISVAGTYMPFAKPAKNTGPVAWTTRVVNNGPDAATNTIVKSTVTSKDAFVRFESVSATQGSCSISSHVVTCNLGILASGSTATINTTSTTGGLYFSAYDVTNTSVVSSDAIDGNGGNNSSSVTLRTN